jgi:hypothetical protein
VVPASTSLAYVGLAVAGNGDVDHGEVRHSIRMIRGQGERDGAAPVVARDSVPGESQVLTQQLVDVGRDRPLVVATGGPGRIAQTAQVRRHEAVLVLQLCDHLAPAVPAPRIAVQQDQRGALRRP